MSIQQTRKSVAALVLFCALAGQPAAAQDRGDILPLPQIIAAVAKRYQGEVVAAEVEAGDDDDEPDFYYELRLIAPAGNVLRIRMDALTARFLEVDGRGLIEARRMPLAVEGTDE